MDDEYIDQQLAEAYIRFSRRKEAVAGGENRIVAGDNARGVFVGTDLIPEHAIFFAIKSSKLILAAILLEEIDIDGAFVSQWIDGFLTGLELAAVREKDKAEA